VCSKSGRTFNVRSGFERDIGQLLDREGFDFDYESTKFRYPFPIPGAYCEYCYDESRIHKDRIYTPDFVIGDIYLECKGKLTAAERKKFEAIRDEWPELDLRFLFMRDNWLTKAHKSRYSDWAKRIGYPYSIGVNLDVLL
jgi:hypothetical protein